MQSGTNHVFYFIETPWTGRTEPFRWGSIHNRWKEYNNAVAAGQAEKLFDPPIDFDFFQADHGVKPLTCQDRTAQRRLAALNIMANFWTLPESVYEDAYEQFADDMGQGAAALRNFVSRNRN